MILTVILPDGQGLLSVADDVLVFDGFTYVPPSVALYVELFRTPVEALSLPWREVTTILETAVRIRARVVDRNPVPADTDPDVIVVPDPTGGECVCGITCAGTQLQFVKVHTLEIP